MAEQVKPKRGGTLREGFDYDFSRVDPAAGAHVDPPWCAIYETAVVFDEGSQPGPMLATGWRTDSDAMTWRLRVRAGAIFQSGRPCDAAAVAAAYNLHSDPVASPVNQFFWSPVRSVAAEGDEVVIRLHHPYAGLPTLLRSWHSAIHNQAMREELGDDYGRGAADGTGPFRLSRWRPGELLEVRRWGGYPGTAVSWFQNQGPAYLDAIQWVPLLSEEGRAQALEDGVVDCIQNPSLLHVDRLKDHPDLRVVTYQQSSLAYLALDHETSRLGFHDPRVRQAISHAINRSALVARDLAGYGWPAYGPVPSASPWYAREVEAFNQYDPAKAGALLDAAGYPAGPDGVRLSFTALVLQDATLRRVAASVQEMLGRVGVRLELRYVDGFAEFYGALGDHPEAFFSKWLWPDPVDAIIGFVSSWSHQGPNWQRAADPDIDQACRGWQRAADAAAQRQAASAIQRLSAERLPLLPLYSPAAVWAHHQRVHGWRPTPSNLYPFYNDVWLDE